MKSEGNELKIAKGVQTAGEAIRSLRLNKLLTQGDMAEQFDIKVSYWSLIENDKKPVPQNLIQKIADFFSLSTSDKERFKNLANNSVKQQKLDLTGTRADVRNLALSFAKQLKDLDSDQVSEIQKILKRSKNM
jgi:transcriptional regulator with XRE-family HTH domain